MIVAWYCVVSFILIAYIVLDGRNFGAGMLHLIVARTREERRQVVAAIGPLWSWHEVWLVAFGGTLIAAFPKLMAASFSGYYLALFLILWALLLRGMALEVGGHIKDSMWEEFWDVVFAISSFLLAILFGTAGGNMARGVPIEADGRFAMSFFTNFNVYGRVGLLDWYTLSIAVFASVLLAGHGANYLTLKTEGPVHDRSAFWAKRLWLLSVPLLVIVSAETLFVRPGLLLANLTNPFFLIGLMVVGGSAFAVYLGIRENHESMAFAGSNFLLMGMLGTGAAAIFPVMLFSTLAPENSLTAYAVAASPGSLFMAALWWPVAFFLACSYFVFIARQYAGKVSVKRDTQGYY